MQDLERLLSDLRADDSAAVGAELEDRVWRQIASIRRSRTASVRQLPFRAGIVLGALGIGLALGGASVARDHHTGEAAALSLTGQLAPSTLLIGS